jgi:hypothetical protein
MLTQAQFGASSAFWAPELFPHLADVKGKTLTVRQVTANGQEVVRLVVTK